MDHSSLEKDKEVRRVLPWGVGILVIVQLLFFFTVQFDNYRYRQVAIKYYFDSELYKTEFPLYTRYLQKYMANDVFYRRLETISSGNMPNIELYWLIYYDPFFQREIETVGMPENSLNYVSWQQKRSEYNHFSKGDIAHTYGFNSAKPTILGIVVSLFSNENFIQFIINVLFLLIVGLLLEARIGMKWLISSYLLGGLLMISLYCVVAPFSRFPIAATNGEIMGLLGLLISLYGTKKEKIYYYNGRDVSSVYVACFLFLPFWIVIQYALYSLGMIDILNLCTQIFPFIGGGILGYYLKEHVDQDNLGEDLIPGTDDLKERFQLVERNIEDLDFEKAKKILYELLEEYPTNKEVHMAMFNVVKSKPASEEYHDIVKKIFSFTDMATTTTSMINMVFNNYIKRAQPSVRLDAAMCFNLIQRFRKAGFYDDANKILKVLIKKTEIENLSENLAREHFLLAKSYFMKGDSTEANALIDTLMANFPNSDAAKNVQEMLDAKKKPLG